MTKGRLSFRIKQSEAERLETLAIQLGWSLSEFIRRACFEKASKIEADGGVLLEINIGEK